MNLVLTRLLYAQSIVNMTPSLLPLNYFDAAVLPDHDLAPNFELRPNTLVTPLALGYHDTAQAQFLAGTLAREYGFDPAGRYIGLALGGPSRHSPWTQSTVLHGLQLLLAAAQASGSQILATNSRRTPEWCTQWLEAQRKAGALAAFIDANKDSRNPLPALYELCWQLHISADSISMISEAVHAGHRPVLHATAPGGPRGKLRRFINNLASGGDVFSLGSALPAESLRRPERINAVYEKLRRQLRELLHFTD
jgi:mitochondrial fission protein ELM1